MSWVLSALVYTGVVGSKDGRIPTLIAKREGKAKMSMSKENASRAFWCALLLSLILLSGCVRETVATRTDDRFWKKPSPMELYRGLKSGMTPTQTQAAICRRWSFGGRCSSLEQMGHKTYFRLMGQSRAPLDLKLFRYREPDGAYPCQYFFFFREWGLSQVRSYCSPREPGQITSQIRRYRRIYGKPLKVLTRRGGRVKARVWQDKAPHRTVMLLLVRKRILIGVHQDIRLDWTQFVDRLRPELSDHFAHDWRVWQGMPLPMRQELLEHFSRMLLRLKRLIADHPLARLPSTGWGPKQPNPTCTPVALEHWRHAFGRSRTWRRLRFLPTRQMRLQYKWETKGGSIYSRTFTLRARGCGYRIKLTVDQSGRKIGFRRLRFSKIGGTTKKKGVAGAKK